RHLPSSPRDPDAREPLRRAGRDRRQGPARSRHHRSLTHPPNRSIKQHCRMSQPKTVFFTGGAGFIGMHVIPMLLDRGYHVRLFDNMFRGDRDKVAELTADGRVELIDQDIRYGGAVHQAMKGCESVIHFAAVSINKSQADPYESIDINMVGNHNVFAAAADHGVRRVVFASSASVYGDPQKIPMHEDDPLHPLTPYCISKRAGE